MLYAQVKNICPELIKKLNKIKFKNTNIIDVVRFTKLIVHQTFYVSCIWNYIGSFFTIINEVDGFI